MSLRFLTTRMNPGDRDLHGASEKSQPTDVTMDVVEFGYDRRHGECQGNLTFTSSNWNAEQTVTITGVADNLSDGDQSYAIRLLATTPADPLSSMWIPRM